MEQQIKPRSHRQFHIRTILVLTVLVAFLMAFRTWAFTALTFFLLFVHLALFFGPVVIIFAAITSGRQVENRIDIKNNRIIEVLLKAWLGCIVTVVLFWSVLSMLYSF